MGFVIWTFDIFITLKSWIIQFEFDFICLKSWILTNIINKIVPRVVNNFFDYVCRNSVFQTNKISFESNNSRFPFHTNVTFVMVIVEIIKPIISTGLPIISTYSLGSLSINMVLTKSSLQFKLLSFSFSWPNGLKLPRFQSEIENLISPSYGNFP